MKNNMTFTERFFIRRYNRFPNGKMDIFWAFSSLILFVALDLYIILMFLPKTITYLSESKSLLKLGGGAILFVLMCILVNHLMTFIQQTFKNKKEMDIAEGDQVSIEWEKKTYLGVVQKIEKKPIALNHPVYVITTDKGKTLRIPLNGMMLDLRTITNHVTKR